MGKTICQWYNSKDGSCDNEDCLEKCSFQPGHFEKCAFAHLVDVDVLEAEYVSDNYDSHGRLLE